MPARLYPYRRPLEKQMGPKKQKNEKSKQSYPQGEKWVKVKQEGLTEGLP